MSTNVGCYDAYSADRAHHVRITPASLYVEDGPPEGLEEDWVSPYTRGLYGARDMPPRGHYIRGAYGADTVPYPVDCPYDSMWPEDTRRWLREHGLQSVDFVNRRAAPIPDWERPRRSMSSCQTNAASATIVCACCWVFVCIVSSVVLSAYMAFGPCAEHNLNEANCFTTYWEVHLLAAALLCVGAVPLCVLQTVAASNR